ncbi:hypothetical protein RIF29_15480 [Crotalaria pallida]|uniref:Protein FAR1-RELATED SEQUENCE n=1 Tax=Crotalaria pallida TaxID=3830 RepID=A0AAN9FJ60_CROPI
MPSAKKWKRLPKETNSALSQHSKIFHKRKMEANVDQATNIDLDSGAPVKKQYANSFAEKMMNVEKWFKTLGEKAAMYLVSFKKWVMSLDAWGRRKFGHIPKVIKGTKVELERLQQREQIEECEDKLIWKFNENGEYSVKSGYHFLMESKLDGLTDEEGKPLAAATHRLDVTNEPNIAEAMSLRWSLMGEVGEVVHDNEFSESNNMEKGDEDDGGDEEHEQFEGRRRIIVDDDADIRAFAYDKLTLDWHELVESCGLDMNSGWVKEANEKKKMWATTYLKGSFFAGLRTTSRCEGLHSMFGRYVESRNSLYELLQHYHRWLDYIRHNQHQKDYNSWYKMHVLNTHLPKLERSATLVYSHDVFHMF